MRLQRGNCILQHSLCVPVVGTSFASTSMSGASLALHTSENGAPDIVEFDFLDGLACRFSGFEAQAKTVSARSYRTLSTIEGFALVAALTIPKNVVP